MVDLEVLTEQDEMVNLTRGGKTPVLRVRYRRAGTRRWTSFVIIPTEGQALAELEANAHEAAVVHSRCTCGGRHTNVDGNGGHAVNCPARPA